MTNSENRKPERKPEPMIPNNDDIETPHDIFHRGTRTSGPAQVDSQGRAREQFDATGRPLALDDDGALHPATDGATEEPPEPSPGQEAQSERLEIMRQTIGFVALGESDI